MGTRNILWFTWSWMRPFIGSDNCFWCFNHSSSLSAVFLEIFFILLLIALFSFSCTELMLTETFFFFKCIVLSFSVALEITGGKSIFWGWLDLAAKDRIFLFLSWKHNLWRKSFFTSLLPVKLEILVVIEFIVFWVSSSLDSAYNKIHYLYWILLNFEFMSFYSRPPLSFI